MRVTSKGQVTIPIEMRRKYGIKPDMEVEFIEGEDGPLIVVKEDDGQRGDTLTKRQRSERSERMLARMRGAAWKSDLTTDELMAHLRGWGDDDPGR